MTGLGIESSSFRDGLPHESVLETGHPHRRRRDRHRAPRRRARGPVPDFPNSYGTPRLRHPAADRARPVSPYVALRHVRLRPRRAGHGDRRDRCRPSTYDGEPVRLRRRGRVQPGRGLPDAGPRTATPPVRTSDYTGQQIFYRSIQRAADATSSPRTTICGAGTPTGSGARGPSAPSNPSYGGCGRGAGGAATSTTRSSGSRTGFRCRRASTAGAGGRTASGSSRTSRSRSTGWPGSCAGSTPRSGCGRSGCARCGCAGSARLAAVPAASRARPTSTSASGARCAIAPGAADGDVNRRDRGRGRRVRRAQIAVLRRVLRPRHLRPALQRPGPDRGEGTLRPGRPADRALREGGDAPMTTTRDPGFDR